MIRYKCGREIKESDVCYYNNESYVVVYVNHKLSIMAYDRNSNDVKTITAHIADNLEYGQAL